MLLLFFALIFLAIATALIARALTGDVSQQEPITRIAAYGFSAASATGAGSGGRQLRLQDRLESLALWIGGLMERYIGTEGDPELRRQLYGAGLYRLTPRSFRGYRALATIVLAAFWLWIGINGGSAFYTIFGLLTAAALGWIMPLFVVKRRAAARVDRIDYEMPELVDLLVTAVEGGLGFVASLQLAAREFEGPLGDELRIALREQQMGLTMNEALANMSSRVDSVAVRSFVQAVIQGEALGVSIGKVLRDIAREMRRRRRQAAEERAHKAATKILAPLVILIFPAMFVVTLGPAIASIIKNLGAV